MSLSFITNHFWKHTLLIFLFFGAMLALIQFSFPGLFDTDPYYHFRHAMLYKEGLKNSFPWVQLTPFEKNYSDLWYGYHQFLRILPEIHPILEVKLFIVFSGTLVLTTFYFILYRLNIQKPFLWTIALVALSPFFLTRLLTLRPHVFDIFFLLLCIFFLIKRRPISIGILMAIFVWFHQLAPLLLVLILLWSAVESMMSKRLEWKTPLSALCGFAIGIALHPGPSMYLYSMYLSVIKIPIFSYLHLIPNFGNELQVNFFGSGGTFIHWIMQSGLLFLLFLFAIIAMLKKLTVPSVQHFCLLTVTLVWFLLSIMTSRAMEWFVPLCILFIAYTITEIFPSSFTDFSKKINVTIFIGVLLCVSISQNMRLLSNDMIAYTQSSFAVGQWLEKNTPTQTTVANQWDIFPYLFFSNQSNRYIAAYDPIFLYEYDPKLSWLWYHLWNEGVACESKTCETSGNVDDVGDIFIDRFHANYLVVDSVRASNEFLNLLEKSSRFTKRFSDGIVSVYGPTL